MAGIILKQADGSTVLPKDDAILYDMIVNQSGYIHGCEVTWQGGNQIHIGAGYGIIKGRVFEVDEQTVYAKLPTESGKTYYGYLVIAVDLEQNSVRIATYANPNEMTVENGGIEQDQEFNYDNGIWELVIAEYNATSTAITSFVTKWEKVEGVYQTIKSFPELAALNEQGYIVDALLIKKQILTFSNVRVPVSAWLENTTYEDYPYRASIGCNGVDSNYSPNIVFDLKDAISGIFAPIATTLTGTVCIYANEIPSYDLTIPTIQCIRKVG